MSANYEAIKSQIEAIKSQIESILSDAGLSVHLDYLPGVGMPKGEVNRNNLPRFVWSVTVTVGTMKLVTRFECGHGLIQGLEYNHSRSVSDIEQIVHACKNGMVEFTRINPPRVADVIACLLLDSSAIDYPDFESWASEFGYDTDSRKAESIYRECIEIGLKLRAMLGETRLSQLRELANQL